ncbi:MULTISPECIES: J domain-containing protein [Vibrio]|uniref:J domain-containing protein n=1 Tax=Vibrio tasmaniensis TaxID=212663 RepID=A0A0H3ZNZ6_9VIBR|nr:MULTISPECIES: J domain-containing protein [Vibrio]AKN38048.1 hypothetical protein [Vibrio tasmaniensis]OCH55033.1 hypothetical protein A6E08_20765 [Vibrio lentus]PMI60773.1 hypothetical protein BCU43_08585 [Vibrio lentus]TCT62818.1 DnaJ-like protein [Vibrio crassostreae]
MNTNEALSILELIEENKNYSAKEIKAAYRKMINQYHPDKDSGNVHYSQLINSAYKVLKGLDEVIFSSVEMDKHISKKLQDAINAIVNLDGLIIEVIGSWIWVTGETKKHKEILKENSYFYSRSKKAWYFKTGDRKRVRGSKSSLDDIRNSHGSQVVKSSSRKKLAA